MKEMINDEENKKKLIAVLFIIIFVGLVGALLVCITNPKYVLISCYNDLTRDITNTIEKEIVRNDSYLKNYTTKMEVKYIIGEEENKSINVNINKNSENLYNVIEMVSENGEKYQLYQKDEKLALDVTSLNKLIQITDKVNLETVTKKSFDNYKLMYDKVLKKVEKQLIRTDFYKMKIEEGTSDNKVKYVKYGVRISEKRLKEIIISVLEDLKKDDKFITAYIETQKNISKEDIDKNDVIARLNEVIESLNQYEASTKKRCDIVVTASGFLKRKIEKIEFLSLDENEIIEYSGKVVINEQGLILSLAKQEKTLITINITNKEYGKLINVVGIIPESQTVYDISVDINDYDYTKNIVFWGKINQFDFNCKYDYSYNMKANELDNNLRVTIYNNKEQIFMSDIKSNTNFEGKKLDLEEKQIYKADELNETEKQEYESYIMQIVGSVVGNGI